MNARMLVAMVVMAGALTPAIGVAQLNVGGTVFDDLNRSGSRDPGEPGRAGVTVTLDIGIDGLIDFSGLTDGNGNYAFLNLANGTMRVRVVPPPGSVSTTQTTFDLNLPPTSASPPGIDFGLAPAPTATVPTLSDALLAFLALLLALAGVRGVGRARSR